MGDLRADADRRRPGGADDDPGARDRRPARARGRAPSSATARSRSPAACPRTASWSLRARAGVRRPRPRRTSSAPGSQDRRRDPGRPGRSRRCRTCPRIGSPSTSPSSTPTRSGYPGYYEQCLRLLRPGGLLMLDNVFMGGRDPRSRGRRRGRGRDRESSTTAIAADERVDVGDAGHRRRRHPGPQALGPGLGVPTTTRGLARAGQGGHAAVLAAASPRAPAARSSSAAACSAAIVPQGARPLGLQLRLLRGRRAAARLPRRDRRRLRATRASGLDGLGARGRRRDRGRRWRRAGHVLDAAPRGRWRWTSCASRPREPSFEIARARGLRRAGSAQRDRLRLSRQATSRPSPRRRCPGLRIYFADADGRGRSARWRSGRTATDAVVIWVATLPEARGQGIAGRLLAHAPARRARGRAARRRRCSRPSSAARSTSGSATATTALSQMWERRRT